MTSLQDKSSLIQGMARYGTGTRHFLGWWKQGLLQWVPLRWHALLGLADDRLLLADVDDGIQLYLQHAGGLRELARLPAPLEGTALDAVLGRRLRELPRWLLLPGDSALRRRLILPAAAADRLRDVVGFEIDRQTPFAADAVRFDARISGRRTDGHLETELVAVPRAQFDMALAGLGSVAASLTGVDLRDGNGQPTGVNLLPEELRRNQHDPLRIWNLVLAAAGVVAIAAAAWQVLENRRNAAEVFAAEVETHAIAARAVATQRQRLVDIVEGSAFLDRSRAARATTVEILDELSRRLPDNTYLDKVSIEGNQLLIIGLSPEASALVARLEGSRLWHSPALSGALQPDPRAKMDRFSLTADLSDSSAAASSTGEADGAAKP